MRKASRAAKYVGIILCALTNTSLRGYLDLRHFLDETWSFFDRTKTVDKLFVFSNAQSDVKDYNLECYEDITNSVIEPAPFALPLGHPSGDNSS